MMEKCFDQTEVKAQDFAEKFVREWKITKINGMVLEWPGVHHSDDQEEDQFCEDVFLPDLSKGLRHQNWLRKFAFLLFWKSVKL